MANTKVTDEELSDAFAPALDKSVSRGLLEVLIRVRLIAVLAIFCLPCSTRSWT